MKTVKLITAAIIVPAMMITGFRFSKEFRNAESGIKSFVFRFVNTIQANMWAERV